MHDGHSRALSPQLFDDLPGEGTNVVRYCTQLNTLRRLSPAGQPTRIAWMHSCVIVSMS